MKNKGIIGALDSETIKWAAQRRLNFIDFRLQWDGRINRRDLIDAFDISTPQASNDLRLYSDLAPGNMTYDRREKSYFATLEFEPRFGIESADTYLAQLLSVSLGMRKLEDSFLSWRPPHDFVKVPGRRVSPDILKSILRATRERTMIECRYQSMGRPQASVRCISPVALASNGFRWHVRAYCHKREAFRDFVFSRITDMRVAGESTIDPADDEEWFRYVTVRIGAHPELSENQRSTIEFEYEMEDGEKHHEVRVALLFYFLKNLGLEDREFDRPAKSQQIVLLNRDELIEKAGAHSLP